MNQITILGRLTADPELRTTSQGKSVTQFNIADDIGYGDNKITNFWKIVCWEKKAEFANNYFKKGQRVLIIGEAKKREYVDKNGANQRVTEIIADKLEFADGKPDNSSYSAQNQPQYQAQQNYQQQPQQSYPKQQNYQQQPQQSYPKQQNYQQQPQQSYPKQQNYQQQPLNSYPTNQPNSKYSYQQNQTYQQPQQAEQQQNNPLKDYENIINDGDVPF